MLNLISDKQHT